MAKLPSAVYVLSDEDGDLSFSEKVVELLIDMPEADVVEVGVYRLEKVTKMRLKAEEDE